MDAQKKMDFWFSALYGEKKVDKMEQATVFFCILLNISQVEKLLKWKLWCLATCI
jgi:hypothetical protein